MDEHNPCTGCGACCMHLNTPPFAGEARWFSVPAKLRQEIVAYMDSPRFRDVDQPCLWLDLSTGRCRHHEYRPDICREFDAGSDDCAEARGRFSLTPITINGRPQEPA